MIAQGIEGRKVSGHDKMMAKAKDQSRSSDTKSIDSITSSILGKKVEVSKDTKKSQPAKPGKPEMGNFAGRVQEAFADKDDIRDINQSFQNARKSVQSALLENPVTNLAKNPLKELKDEMKQIKNAAGTIVKAVTSDTVDFTEPNDTLEKRKFEKLQKSLSYIDEGIRKGADRVKKRLKKIFNHPEWYTKFSDYITSNLNWGVRKESQYFRVASGAYFNVYLTIPQKDGAVSRAYIDAITSNFTKLRGSNSGAFNYAVEDVAAYTEVTRGIRAYHAKLVRDIKCLNNVDPYIAQSPNPLLRLCGYSDSQINDMRLNRANYVAELNRLADFIDATFPSQPDMTVYERDKYLATAILEDGKGPKSSLYVTNIKTIMVPSSTNGQLTGFGLSTGTFAQRLMELESIIGQARGYVSATYANTDTFAKISGDIFKAYGQAGLKLRCDKVELSDKAATAFDDYLLHQLQNNTAILMTSATDNNGNYPQATPFTMTYPVTISLDNNQVTTRTIPTNAVLGLMSTNKALAPIPVNTHRKDVTGGEAISLTRNVTVFKYDSDSVSIDKTNTDFDVDIYECDTTVIYGTQIQFYQASNPNDIYFVALHSHILYKGFGYFDDIWAQCDYLPYYQVFTDDNTGNYYQVVDLDMYAYMSIDQIRQFNDSAVASMYKTIDVSDQVNFRSVKR